MSTAIEKFERKNMAAFETLSFIQGQRKALEQQEKEIKEMLLQGMKKHGIASIDNDIVRINYIPESESVSLDTKKWRVEDPDSKTGELLGIMKCSDKTVVTSGTYERYFEAEGKRYHHILDTDTGYPVDTDIVSATIIADKGHSVDGDGLSTSCLALGREKAIKLIQSIDGVEAVIVDSSGDIYMSDDNIPFERS